MAFNDPSYVIFDGDNDAWAYRFMRGWKANDKVDFDFRDAHDLDAMTGKAQDEQYVKRNLRARMEQSAAALVLVGAALDFWPSEFRSLGAAAVSQGARTYSDTVYTSWGL